MDHLRSLLKLYYAPADAISDLMDRGSWLFAAGAVLLVSVLFFATVNAKLYDAYRLPDFWEFYEPDSPSTTEAEANAKYGRAEAAYDEAMRAMPTLPLIDRRFFTFFTFNPATFYNPLILLTIFYVPALILLMSLFGGSGSFGLLLRRDYGTLAVCTLSAWAAAHLPFSVAGLFTYTLALDPQVYFGTWLSSSLLFGVFMTLVLRTVMGAGWGVAIFIIAVAWLSLSLGSVVTQYVGPWLLSPFLLIMLFLYFGGTIGGEVRGFGNAMRQRQNLKRFLQNATVNPRDADAHVQLGLIYLQRRQEAKAVEHLQKALEIDPNEIDANYEMGRIERSRGNLQLALDHFAIVVEQNDKHAVSEIWREIGITYLEAGMLNEAHEALYKFTTRRSADVEGLYYFGKVLKAQGKTDEAREVFQQAIQTANASPDFRRRGTVHWSKLAKKEL